MIFVTNKIYQNIMMVDIKNIHWTKKNEQIASKHGVEYLKRTISFNKKT